MADKEVKFKFRVDGREVETSLQGTTAEIRNAKRELRGLETEGDRFQKRLRNIQDMADKGMLGEGEQGQMIAGRLRRQAQVGRAAGLLRQFGLGRFAALLGPGSAIVAALGLTTKALLMVKQNMDEDLKTRQKARQLDISTEAADAFDAAFPGASQQFKNQLMERAARLHARTGEDELAIGRRLMRESRAGGFFAAQAIIGSAGGEALHYDPNQLQYRTRTIDDASLDAYARMGSAATRARKSMTLMGVLGMAFPGNPYAAMEYNRMTWNMGAEASQSLFGGAGAGGALPVKIVDDDTAEMAGGAD